MIDGFPLRHLHYYADVLHGHFCPLPTTRAGHFARYFNLGSTREPIYKGCITPQLGKSDTDVSHRKSELYGPAPPCGLAPTCPSHSACQITHLVTSAALVHEMHSHVATTACKTGQGLLARPRKPRRHDYTFGMTLARPHPFARLASLALGAFLTFSLSSPAFAQWKWKDKSGHTQYSDLPPPATVSDADILQRPNGSSRKSAPSFAPSSAQAAVAAMAASAASGAASGPTKAVEPELEAKRRKVAEEEAAKHRAEEEKQKVARAENCQRAKGQLKALEDGMRMSRINAKGEQEILDDKGRAEESKRARDVATADCK